MIEPTLARAYGTLAGYGFIGSALVAVPSTRLLDPLPEAHAYFLTLAAVLTGLLCLAIPWDWLDPRWLHVVGVVATAEAAAAVALFGPPYVVFFFVIAVAVAYIAPDVKSVSLQLGLICLALFAPVAYGPEDVRSSLQVALAAAPMLLLTGALFAFLRQKQVHDRRAYHRFAEQTLILSSQIAGRPLGPPTIGRAREPVPRLSRVRPSRPILGSALVAVSVPLFAGGLAVAGVRLPDLANEPFEQIGIDLPNQEGDAAPAAISLPPAHRQDDAQRGISGDKAVGDERNGGASEPKTERKQGGAASGPDPVATTPQTGGVPAPAAPPAPTLPGVPDVPGPGGPAAPPGGGGGGAPAPLDGILDEASKGLGGLLENLGIPGPQDPAQPPSR